jgi:hypothetical protein
MTIGNLLTPKKIDLEKTCPPSILSLRPIGFFCFSFANVATICSLFRKRRPVDVFFTVINTHLSPILLLIGAKCSSSKSFAFGFKRSASSISKDKLSNRGVSSKSNSLSSSPSVSFLYSPAFSPANDITGKIRAKTKIFNSSLLKNIDDSFLNIALNPKQQFYGFYVSFKMII